MSNPIETAKTLLDQQAEINKLKRKLDRVKNFVTTYTNLSATHRTECDDLATGVIDIIDNAYETPEDKE